MSELTKNAFQEAEEIGEKRGEERGVEIGKTDQQNRVITQCFNKGLPFEMIAELTGLSKEALTQRIQELGLEDELRENYPKKLWTIDHLTI